MDTDFIQEMIDDDPSLAGWEVINEYTVCCADHGYSIEWDGVCPEGCVSAVRQLGMI